MLLSLDCAVSGLFFHPSPYLSATPSSRCRLCWFVRDEKRSHKRGGSQNQKKTKNEYACHIIIYRRDGEGVTQIKDGDNNIFRTPTVMMSVACNRGCTRSGVPASGLVRPKIERSILLCSHRNVMQHHRDSTNKLHRLCRL